MLPSGELSQLPLAGVSSKKNELPSKFAIDTTFISAFFELVAWKENELLILLVRKAGVAVTMARMCVFPFLCATLKRLPAFIG